MPPLSKHNIDKLSTSVVFFFHEQQRNQEMFFGTVSRLCFRKTAPPFL